MRISSLRYFYEVAELKSISKVSNNLHISQPALSHQLSKIEKELGVKLFERSNRGVELTAKGQILYNYARQILALHKNLTEEIEEDNSTRQEIKINVSCVHAGFVMENIAKEIGKIFKNTNISINSKKEANDKALLLHNRADVVLGCNKIEDVDLVCHNIGKDNLILVSKKHVECNKRSKLSIAILDDYMEIVSKDVEKFDTMNISLTTDSLEVIKSYLNNDNVAAVVPSIAVKDELKSGSLVELCSNAYGADYNLYFTYRKDIEQCLKKKIKILQKELEDLLNINSIYIEI